MKHGGKRPNAGRKKSPHKTKIISFRVRPEWEKEIRILVRTRMFQLITTSDATLDHLFKS
jgi:hypothetical protein